MKNLTIKLELGSLYTMISVMLLFGSMNFLNAQEHRCGTDKVLADKMQTDSDYAKKHLESEKKIYKRMTSSSHFRLIS